MHVDINAVGKKRKSGSLKRGTTSTTQNLDKKSKNHT